MSDSMTGIARFALETAKKLGATAAEASVTQGKGMTLIVRNGAIDDLEHEQDSSLGMTVYFGHREGIATTSDLRESSIVDTVTAACDIAKFTQPDPCLGIPSADELATEWPELSLHHPWDISISDATERAIACEQLAMSRPDIKHSDGVEVNTYESTRVFANSHGFLNTFQSTEHSISCSVVAERDGRKEVDYERTIARDSKDLWPLTTIAEEAARKAAAKLGSRQIKTQHAPVLLTPWVAAGLLRSFLKAISGTSLYQRASFLCDSLGQMIFPSHVTLFEDPFIPKGLASSPYDGEGVQVHARTLVESGRLNGYLLDCYSARRLGLKTTGNEGGPHNIQVSSTGHTPQDLLQEMHTGLLVTDVMGQGVNILTGDYSRGCSGFWVEQGKIQFPVSELTIAGNLREMYQHILAIGTDVDPRLSILTGSILINQMMIGGT